MEEQCADSNDNICSDKDNPFRKGCNPNYSTARSKLQKKRSKLNDDIIKELRLRRGAENLLRATNNKKVQEQVLVELEYVNSKLEVLKSDLAALNCSVKIYQNDKSPGVIPMISLGLKETADANFEQVFKDYIEEHYSEPGSSYKSNIDSLHALRKAVRTPERSEAGIELLFSYYNQLCLVEKRFYPPGRSVPVYFTWYDSITGTSTVQKTIGFEKGSILFNIAVLYTQLGTHQDRNCVSGLDQTIEYYQRAAGCLKMLRDRFTHAPSLDMGSETLTLLMQLMLSQSQECVFEKMRLSQPPPVSLNDHTRFAQEAAMVAQMYEETHNAVASSGIRQEVPPSWITITVVKCNHYKSLAHYHVAAGLLTKRDDTPSLIEVQQLLDEVTQSQTNASKNHGYSGDKAKQMQYCRAHINEALNLNEASQKDYSFCRLLKDEDDMFCDRLAEELQRISALLDKVQSDDDFLDVFLNAASIRHKAKHLVSITLPNFSDVKVSDLFEALGPLSVFSAKNEWTVPRTVTLSVDRSQGVGFSLSGDCPSSAIELVNGSAAEKAGIKQGDILVKVNGKDVKWTVQSDIKDLLEANEELQITVVTPMDPVIDLGVPVTDDILKSGRDTVTSSNSGSSEDMKQLNGTMSSTWRKKMTKLTFLKNKKMQKNSSVRRK